MSDWTTAQLAAAVRAYRDMEAAVAAGQRINKTQVYRTLAAQHGRTSKAWEYRMQNISHVLNDLGMPWLSGLRPASNVGTDVAGRLATLLLGDMEVPTATTGATKQVLEKESALISTETSFSPTGVEDERHRVLANIVRRRGQFAFRQALLAAYGGRCAMTGCDVPDVLEAAHVYPYRGAATNSVNNGLLLRADIHTLFDLYLIAVEPGTLRIEVAPKLQDGSYSSLHGACLREVANASQAVNTESLAWHRQQCEW